MYPGGGTVDGGDDDSDSSVSGDDVYKERVKPILVLLFNLYSDKKISVCDNRPFFCSAYMFY